MTQFNLMTGSIPMTVQQDVASSLKIISDQNLKRGGARGTDVQ